MAGEQKDSTSNGAQTKQIRPALVVSRRVISDYSTYLEHLIAGLAAESVRACFICPPRCVTESFLPPTLELIKHPILELPLMGHYNRRLLSERLEKFRPTVFHCLSQDKAWLTRLLARQFSVPYVLTVNSLQKRKQQLSLSPRRCVRIIVPSPHIAVEVRGYYPRFTDRIEQINIGTFTADTAECFDRTDRLASIVTAYSLDYAAEFEKLLGAVRHLVIDGYEFMFVIAGSGKQESQLRKLVRNLGLTEVVVIVPKLSAWRSILAAGDIFIKPQPSESFDPVLLEAMAVGAAVACCKGGVDGLIIDGQTGIVFEPDDELSIYNSLQKLLNRREYARQLANQAQQYLRENHSVAGMVADTLKTYTQTQQWYKSKP